MGPLVINSSLIPRKLRREKRLNKYFGKEVVKYHNTFSGEVGLNITSVNFLEGRG